jgi:hypothetical protein
MWARDIGFFQARIEERDARIAELERQLAEARAALETQTTARKLAQGWCETHGVYHRNYRCDYGFGVD